MNQLLQLTDIPDTVGLTVAAPVIDARGRVLVAAGAALTPSLVAGLQRHGVTEVSVDGVDAPVPADQRDVDRIRCRIEQLFRRSAAGAAGGTLSLWMMAYRTKDPP